MDMEAILASSNHLIEMAGGTHPHPDALVRLRQVLGAAATRCISSPPIYAFCLKQMLANFVRNFGNDIRELDNLTARLQATRSPKGRRHDVSPTAQLAGLHGNDLFRALMALHLPMTAPVELCLEAALAAQRLITHDHLDLFIHLCEDARAVDEFNSMVFMDHIKTLEKFVQEHIDLADAAATSRATTREAK
ncbi:hypothetical protein CFC21_079022 [Triticum aestivum]|uniref:Uncharacterized protein n=2 Tax=Triticum aestivum TaxID=4565 RepID=A0A9R1HY44_WHEAT|nr:uncharacterized protein LOC109747128 [Aegilops tauschii subsp. strangulata]XP_020161808.1 uncharacterized protein LOC109747128 [Aegilops tauschii subsp. strangulata]XP_044398612.1 uncharacterized protein LOC123122477 [Triticum aestivum]XP_044398613.1 uncharacterized protein LOC123122477 [Triticum aestivum]KAF7074112.1 hypothetical protein CFC21_079022 [Triticum aestivum]